MTVVERDHRIVPAFPPPPAAELRRLKLLRTIVRNPIEAWPRLAFELPHTDATIFGRRVVSLMDPDLIKAALVDEAESFNKGEVAIRALKPAIGLGILTADGAHWRWQRRAAAPIFRPDSIRGFVPAMVAAAEATAERWAALPAGSVVDVAHEMMRTTFAIILDTMLADPHEIDPARVEKSISDYLEPVSWQAALTLVGAPHWVPYPGRARASRARHYLRAELAEIIARRRRTGETGSDLLGLLMRAEDAETGRHMNDEEIADNLLTFVTAGHETTALALAWTFYLLSIAPSVEERVVAEIRAPADGRALADRDMAADFPYTRQVLQEAMRLYPPAPMLVRQAIRDVRIGPLDLTAGTNLQVPVHVVHRHRALWDDPDSFDPDRFLPEAVKARHRYAYLPFGAGPRICIGMGFALTEATAVLAAVLGRVRLTLAGAEPPHPVLRVTLRPRGGLPMKTEPRR